MYKGKRKTGCVWAHAAAGLPLCVAPHLHAGDIALPHVNFVSNGSCSPSDHRGEVGDLKAALRAIEAAGVTGRMVAVLSGALVFAPCYNMQRTFEHAFVRGKDILGYRILTSADAAVLGTSGHTVVSPAEDIPVPPVAELVPDTCAGPGQEVAQPLLVLRPGTLACVHGSGAESLVGLAQELMAAQVCRRGRLPRASPRCGHACF